MLLSCRCRLMVIVIIVIFGVFGSSILASSKQRQTITPNKKLQKAPHHIIKSITVYSSGKYTGRIAVYPQESVMKALSRTINSATVPGPGALDVPLEKKDKQRLDELIKSRDLRGFQPKAEWFKEKETCTENYFHLEVVWDDKRAVFACPLWAGIRSDIPKDALATYKHIDQVIDFLWDLKSRYTEKYPIRTVPADSEEGQELFKELDRIWAESLPKMPEEP